MSKYSLNECNDDNDNTKSNNINNNDTNQYNELEILENILYQMDDQIRSLWDNILVPYINDYTHKEILTCLSDAQYYVFYDYMVKNNPSYQFVLDRIHELRK